MSKPVSSDRVNNSHDSLPPIVKIGNMNTASKIVKVKPQTSTDSYLPLMTKERLPSKLTNGSQENLSLPSIARIESNVGLAKKTSDCQSSIPILPPIRVS